MNIVFVALGKQYPKFLYENVKLTKEFFPDCKIYLTFDHDILPAKISKLNVKLFRYVRDERVSRLLFNMTHDKKFRGGFWQLTTDRLFAICQTIIVENLSESLYLESDVRIFPDFPFERLKEIGKLGWTRYNKVRDVPSIIYLPKRQDAEFMHSELLLEYSTLSSNTDMTALNRIARRNLERIIMFPTLVPGLTNNVALNAKNNESWEELNAVSSREFNGIFDGAILGMWLTGQDPRNNYGFTQYLNPLLLSENESYVDPSKGRFIWKSGKLGIEVDSKYVPIYNLHIHSKNESLFKLDNKEFSVRVELANRGLTYRSFSLEVFLRLCLESLSKRKFLRFLLSFLRRLAK